MCTGTIVSARRSMTDLSFKSSVFSECKSSGSTSSIVFGESCQCGSFEMDECSVSDCHLGGCMVSAIADSQVSNVLLNGCTFSTCSTAESPEIGAILGFLGWEESIWFELLTCGNGQRVDEKTK